MGTDHPSRPVGEAGRAELPAERSAWLGWAGHRWARRLPVASVDDLVKRPARRLLDWRKRPARRVAERQ